jgi:hypothetical protein
MEDQKKQPTRKSRPAKPKSAYALALEKVQGEQTVQPVEQQPIQTEIHSDIQKSEHPTIEPVEQPKPKTVKQEKVKTPTQQSIQTAKQEVIQPVKQLDIQTATHTDSKPEKQQRTKGTYYLDMEDIIAIDTIQTKRYRATGKKPEKSEIVSEAIQLLFKQENS